MPTDTYKKPNQHFLPVVLQQGFIADVSKRTDKKGSTYCYRKKVKKSFITCISDTLRANKTYQDDMAGINEDPLITFEESRLFPLIQSMQCGKLIKLQESDASYFLKHYAKRSVLFRKEFLNKYTTVEALAKDTKNFENIVEYLLAEGLYTDFDMCLTALLLATQPNLFNYSDASETQLISKISSEVPKHFHIELLNSLKNESVHHAFKWCEVLPNYSNLILSDCGLLCIAEGKFRAYDIFNYLDNQKVDIVLLPISKDKLLVWHNGWTDDLKIKLNEQNVRQAAFDLSIDECIAAFNQFPEKILENKALTINNHANTVSVSDLSTNPLANLMFNSYGASHSSRKDVSDAFVSGQLTDVIKPYQNKFVDVVKQYLSNEFRVILSIETNKLLLNWVLCDKETAPAKYVTFCLLKVTSSVESLDILAFNHDLNVIQFLENITERIDSIGPVLLENQQPLIIMNDISSSAGCYILLSLISSTSAPMPYSFLATCFVLR